jgi:hypothetical protein
MIGTNNYVAVVAFETDKIDKATGEPKMKRTRFLVNEETLPGAMNALMDYLKTDSRGFDIKSVSESKYEDIIGKKKDKVSVL